MCRKGHSWKQQRVGAAKKAVCKDKSRGRGGGGGFYFLPPPPALRPQLICNRGGPLLRSVTIVESM